MFALSQKLRERTYLQATSLLGKIRRADHRHDIAMLTTHRHLKDMLSSISVALGNRRQTDVSRAELDLLAAHDAVAGALDVATSEKAGQSLNLLREVLNTFDLEIGRFSRSLDRVRRVQTRIDTQTGPALAHIRRNIIGASRRSSQQDGQAVDLTTDVQRHLGIAQVFLNRFLVTHDETDMSRVELALMGLRDVVRRLGRLPEDSAPNKAIQEILKLVGALDAGARNLETLAIARDTRLNKKLNSATAAIASSAEQLKNDALQKLDAGASDVLTRTATANRTLLWMSILAIVLGVLVAALLGRRIATSIRSASGIANAIAQGAPGQPHRQYFQR